MSNCLNTDDDYFKNDLLTLTCFCYFSTLFFNNTFFKNTSGGSTSESTKPWQLVFFIETVIDLWFFTIMESFCVFILQWQNHFILPSEPWKCYFDNRWSRKNNKKSNYSGKHKKVIRSGDQGPTKIKTHKVNRRQQNAWLYIKRIKHTKIYQFWLNWCPLVQLAELAFSQHFGKKMSFRTKNKKFVWQLLFYKMNFTASTPTSNTFLHPLHFALFFWLPIERTYLFFVINFMPPQYLKEIFISGDWITTFHKSFFHLQLAQHSLDILIADELSIGDSLIVNSYDEEKCEYMFTWYQHAVLFKLRTRAGKKGTYFHFIHNSSGHGAQQAKLLFEFRHLDELFNFYCIL